MHVVGVNFDKITLPNDVIEETSKTAAFIQNKTTQDARAAAEIQRAFAEKQKAIADNAYMKELNINFEQYLKIREIEIQKEQLEIVRNKENIHIIMNTGGNSPVPTFSVK